eukprot:TRINITY_DN7619_c0_g1_i1.p1 TRINITY_DN7619_c0_g1~~TRINITY_DN7619_c0_g1_i1.p1  ORF type:complete len:255 (-),score=49.98 TRINITY_DN7619_c0_g1_i1:198-962(-)
MQLLPTPGAMQAPAGWTRSVELLQHGVRVHTESFPYWRQPGRAIAQWFRELGVKRVLMDNWTIPPHPWKPEEVDVAGRCAGSPVCIMWDFSGQNVHQYSTMDYPVMLLPGMLRLPPSTELLANVTAVNGFTAIDEVDAPIAPLPARECDSVTAELPRRVPQQCGVPPPREENDYTRNFWFVQAKVCFSVHFYHPASGVEWHRLAEQAPFGCLPIYETTGDPVAQRMLAQAGAVTFGPYNQMANLAKLALSSPMR